MTQPQTILCPNCHKPGRRQARFCQYCGHDIVLNNPGPRYYITRVVKAGGQGAVYETVGDDGKVYAVKEMLDSFTDPQERAAAIERFAAEARMLQRLAHPRIPRVYTHFEDENRHYLAMDFVQGEDLEEIVAREGALPEQRVLDWAAQICDVLGYLHGNGLIYRDMKPSNVMVERPSGGIKLVDFGIAKVLQSDTRGTQIGTPGYAPPEQYQGIATHQSDIYALGATLHHLLTGRDPQAHPPFSFPAVRDLTPSVSRRTSDAIARALQLKADDRFGSLAEFRDALGIGSTAQPAPAPARARAPIARSAPAPVQAARPAAPAPFVPAQPAGPPQPLARTRSRGRGCIFTLAVVLVLIVLGYLAIDPAAMGALFSATPTPQTLILQPFRTDAEIIVPAETDAAALRSAFAFAFLELARRQYGAGVQFQPNSMTYVGGAAPERLGEDARGVRYRASLEGAILVPKP